MSEIITQKYKDMTQEELVKRLKTCHHYALVACEYLMEMGDAETEELSEYQKAVEVIDLIIETAYID